MEVITVMRRRLLLSTLIVAAGVGEASAFDRNVLVGWGVVGPAQYDQGIFKGMATANLTGFVSLGDSFTLGGLGLAVRATDAPLETLDEFGLAVPFATYHLGRGTAQVGVEIQRANLRKNFYYLAIGLSFGGRFAPDSREKPTSGK
jgi:hypothetical protein